MKWHWGLRGIQGGQIIEGKWLLIQKSQSWQSGCVLAYPVLREGPGKWSWSEEGKPQIKSGEARLPSLWHKCSVPQKNIPGKQFFTGYFSFLEWKRGTLGVITWPAQSHKKSQQSWGCFLNGMLQLDINRKAQSVLDWKGWKPPLRLIGGGEAGRKGKDLLKTRGAE